MGLAALLLRLSVMVTVTLTMTMPLTAKRPKSAQDSAAERCDKVQACIEQEIDKKGKIYCPSPLRHKDYTKPPSCTVTEWYRDWKRLKISDCRKIWRQCVPISPSFSCRGELEKLKRVFCTKEIWGDAKPTCIEGMRLLMHRKDMDLGHGPAFCNWKRNCKPCVAETLKGLVRNVPVNCGKTPYAEAIGTSNKINFAPSMGDCAKLKNEILSCPLQQSDPKNPRPDEQCLAIHGCKSIYEDGGCDWDKTLKQLATVTMAQDNAPKKLCRKKELQSYFCSFLAPDNPDYTRKEEKLQPAFKKCEEIVENAFDTCSMIAKVVQSQTSNGQTAIQRWYLRPRH